MINQKFRPNVCHFGHSMADHLLVKIPLQRWKGTFSKSDATSNAKLQFPFGHRKVWGRDLFYWPGMSLPYTKDDSKESLLSHSVQIVGADSFELQKKEFLIFVDYYSGYVKVDQSTRMSANQVIAICKSQFSIVDHNFLVIRFDALPNNISLIIRPPAHITPNQMVWLRKLCTLLKD